MGSRQKRERERDGGGGGWQAELLLDRMIAVRVPYSRVRALFKI